MENREKEHLLALKVMRLTRPSLYTTHPIASDSRYFTCNLLNSTLKKDLGSPDKLEYFSSGNLLMLPQSFGNIYLGETFSCYMSVHNDSQQTVTNVSVQADLQIGMQKIVLTGHRGNYNSVTKLNPDESVDDVIHHEVKEIGTHILACTVSYTSNNNEKMHFRKFFKFQVSKPLDVKTKFYNAEVRHKKRDWEPQDIRAHTRVCKKCAAIAQDYVCLQITVAFKAFVKHKSDEVYLEAPLQNITYAPMCLEKVALEPSTTFASRQLNTYEDENGVHPIFGEVNCLNPLDSRQYLFCLTPKPGSQVNVKLFKGIASIGKLDIVWRTSMGEKGRLQTSQLERMAPGYGEIRMFVEEIPSIVTLEKPFPVTLRVTNAAERALDLVLTLHNTFTNGILWQGVSGQKLNKVEKNSFVLIPLEAIPVKPGLQMISGIKVKELFLKRMYDFDEIAQVFVSSETM